MASDIFLKSVAKSIEKVIECPVCLETVRLPVRECLVGHVVCGKCADMWKKCSLCQAPFILKTSPSIVKLLEALPRFCRYSEEGCPTVLGEEDQHEKLCQYRPISCREPSCNVVSPLITLWKHYNEIHKEHFIFAAMSKATEHSINIDQGNVYILAEFGLTIDPYNSWISIRNNIVTNRLEVKLLHLNDNFAKTAKNLRARILFGHDDPFLFSHCLKFSEDVTVNEDCNEEEMDEDEFCMRIPYDAITKLADEDGNVEFGFKVFKVK